LRVIAGLIGVAVVGPEQAVRAPRFRIITDHDGV